MKRNLKIVALSSVTTLLVLFLVFRGMGRVTDVDELKSGGENVGIARAQCLATYDKCLKEASGQETLVKKCKDADSLCESLSYGYAFSETTRHYQKGWPLPMMTRSVYSNSYGESGGSQELAPIGLLVDAGIFFAASLVSWELLLRALSAIRARRAKKP